MIDTDNNIDVMYFHGKTVDGYRYTISGVVKDGDLLMGIAICSDNDHFNKAKGRTISTGRVLNQRSHPVGRNIKSLYSDGLENDYKGKAGFPKDYFVGHEISVFTAYVKNFNHLTKKELQQEFRLLRQNKS